MMALLPARIGLKKLVSEVDMTPQNILNIQLCLNIRITGTCRIKLYFYNEFKTLFYFVRRQVSIACLTTALFS